MKWYGPQTGSCGCCNEETCSVPTSGGDELLCMDNHPDYYPSVEIEVTGLSIADGDCTGCSGLTLSGTFVAPLSSVPGSNEPFFTYTETDLITGCDCNPPSYPADWRMQKVSLYRVDFFVVDRPLENKCCLLSAAVSLTESGIRGVNIPISNTASKSFEIYRSTQIESGDVITFDSSTADFISNSFTSAQQGFRCVCNYSGGGPSSITVTIP